MAVSKDVAIIESLDAKIETLELIRDMSYLNKKQQEEYEYALELRKGYGRICVECDDSGEVPDIRNLNQQDTPRYKKCSVCGGSKTC